VYAASLLPFLTASDIPTAVAVDSFVAVFAAVVAVYADDVAATIVALLMLLLQLLAVIFHCFIAHVVFSSCLPFFHKLPVFSNTVSLSSVCEMSAHLCVCVSAAYVGWLIKVPAPEIR
jgi:hypothetical protein